MLRPPRRAIILALALAPLAAPIGCGPAPTAPALAPVAMAAAGPDYERDVAPVLAAHCASCHSPAEPGGDVVLTAPPPPGGARRHWARVADQLRAGTMPPPGEPRPSDAATVAVLAWAEDRAVVDRGPGRVVLRRLNRAEYDNAIRDLVGLDLRLAVDFPADDSGHGFDNNGDVLSLPPVLMERYVEAAEAVVEAAFADPEARRRIVAPPPDPTPPAERGYRPPARSGPRKRVGVPTAAELAPDPELARTQRIYDVVRGVADRAYRRPARHDDLLRLVGLAEAARADGAPPDECLKLALGAVLVSPRFLFQVETDPTPTVHRLDPFELAARLAAFLWSSLPDAELARAARQGELSGAGLERQVRRMLRDDRGAALAANFAGQWLQTRNLREVAPDPTLFPGFDEDLRRALAREAELFVGAILREDRPVDELIAAPFTFVDARLARHYGIAGVEGDAFRRVATAGSGRGGVATLGGVLAVTSHPTRTSPVRRGKWLLDNVLGMPPSPPPPGAGDLAPVDDAGADHPSLRRRLERHRADPSCASCHARIDPLGFALENFDAVGAYRVADEAGPIDATGSSPALGELRGAAGLRAALLARRELFARCLAEKLLTYALGRGLGPGDRPAVAAILRRLDAEGGRSTTLILAIVASDPFQYRDGRLNQP